MDMRCNSLGDRGAKVIMGAVKGSKSVVQVNLASNDLSNEGMCVVFEILSQNESVVSLNVSTVEGFSRNRMGEKAAEELGKLLGKGMLQILDVGGVGMGDKGLDRMCSAATTNLVSFKC